MAKIIWGIDPLAASRIHQPEGECPLSAADFARLGIPARKCPRVRQELARFAAEFDKPTLEKLAVQFARRLW